MGKNICKKNSINKVVVLAIILSITFVFSACEYNTKTYDYIVYDFLGTTCYIEINSKGGIAVDRQIDSCFNQIESELANVSAKFSTEDKNSFVSKYNSLKFGESVEVDSEFSFVFTKAKEIYSETQGAFNPAVKLLTDLWGFSKRHSQNEYMPTYPYDREREADGSFSLPQEKYIQGFLALSDFSECNLEGNILSKNCNDIIIDDITYSQQIDLSSIVKGYAGDKVKEIIDSYNFTSYYFSIGTSSMYLAEKLNGSDYDLGITDPNSPNGKPIDVVKVNNLSVSTSGTYQNCYTYNNVLYHHIINSKTGESANTDIESISVFLDSGMVADALTTAILVMGREKGEEFLQSKGIKYIIISNGQVIKNQFSWDDGKFF